MSGANSRRIYPDARRALLILSGAFASSVEWSYAFADNWLVTTGISARETYTTNVDLSPSDQARGDFVTELTPRIGISGAGARVKLSGTLSATGVAYAHESQKDQVLPQVNLLGNVEALEKLFYVEGSVTASQSYISPLGTQQPTNVNINQNRYTYIQYRLSPYIQTTLPSSTTLLVRSDNSWTNATQTSFALAKSYDNHSIARLDHAPTPWGWTAEFDRDDLKYSDQPSLVQQLVRGKIRHLLRPDLEISASAGYEWNRLTLTEENNAIYGAGISWHPSERTTLTGSWEHRFFGPSYSLQFDHRTPLSAWTFTASRNTTNYPQNFLSLPTGGNVAALVDAAFTTRFPDPLQRQQAVSQFLSQTSLPAQLDSPVNFYTEQITLTRLISGTVALIGARNVIAFTAFESKNRSLEPPSTVPLPTLLLSQNNTQRGVNASFSHLLSALTSMNVGATLIRAREDATQDVSVPGKSTQEFFQFLVQTQLGPKTIAFTGARYSIYNAEVFNSYREAAVFVGFDHRF